MNTSIYLNETFKHTLKSQTKHTHCGALHMAMQTLMQLTYTYTTHHSTNLRAHQAQRNKHFFLYLTTLDWDRLTLNIIIISHMIKKLPTTEQKQRHKQFIQTQFTYLYINDVSIY